MKDYSERKLANKIVIALFGFILGLVIHLMINKLKSPEKLFTRYKEFNKTTGFLITDAFYDLNDKRFGIERSYHDNGLLSTIASYENDKIDTINPFITFNDNGEIWYIEYKNLENQNSKVVTFQKNHIKLSQIKYDKYGRKHGESIIYDTLGQISKTEYFERGELIKPSGRSQN